MSAALVDPVAAPPPRRPRSVRRTSTLLATWEADMSGPLAIAACGRDLLTREAGSPPQVLASASLTVQLAGDRHITSVSSEPTAELTGLLGARPGSRMRALLDDVDAAENGLLRALLDDLPGITLIAPFAFSRWDPQWPPIPAEHRAAVDAQMTGICTGFAPGSSALGPEAVRQSTAPAPALADPADPWSWHELPRPETMGMRRARRLDVWCSQGQTFVDAMFRDSTWDPDGSEHAVHEYLVSAVFDGDVLTSVDATPRVLPYVECPGAAGRASRVLGRRAAELSAAVPTVLSGVLGCTHLNDALRGLSVAPSLSQEIAT
jgi:hypothetical protein